MSVLLAGVVGVAVVARERGPSYPSAWDARVAPIASWVEQQRGLTYKTPVYVDFLPVEEFKATVEKPVADATDADRAQAERTEGFYRSVGLVQGDVDLLDGTRSLKGSGTLAFYSTETKRVTVRGTELTPDIRVTVAHELTHALQDQHFTLDVSGDKNHAGGEVLRALAEGDAVHVQQAYVTQMSETDRRRYEDEQKAGFDEYSTSTSAVPDVLRAAFGAPYIVGQPFVEFLYLTKGHDGVDAAFRDPPTALGSIADPIHYLSRTPVVDLDPPETSGTKFDEGRFDAVQLFLMLSARIDPHDALDAVDLWGGDSYVAEETGGRVCSSFVFAARSDTPRTSPSEAARQLEVHLDAWQAAMPDEADASVTLDDDRVRIHTCDPGASADQAIKGTPSDAMVLMENRIYAMASAMNKGASAEQAKCAADGFIAAFTVEQLRDENAVTKETITETLADATRTCPA